MANEPSKAKRALGEAADALNLAMEQAEEAIVALDWKVAADATLAQERTIPGVHYLLRFGRRRDTYQTERHWCMWLARVEGGKESWIDLYSAPIQLRLEAAQTIPQLMNNMRAEVAAQLKGMREAVAQLNEFLDGLQRVKSISPDDRGAVELYVKTWLEQHPAA